MNLWTHSERKWALEPESKPEIEEWICIIKICPIKWIKPLTPMDTDNLTLYGQRIEFY